MTMLVAIKTLYLWCENLLSMLWIETNPTLVASKMYKKKRSGSAFNISKCIANRKHFLDFLYGFVKLELTILASLQSSDLDF